MPGGQHVADLVFARFARRPQSGRAAAAGTDVAVYRARLGTRGDDGDVVGVVDRALPGHFQLVPGLYLRRRRQPHPGFGQLHAGAAEQLVTLGQYIAGLVGPGIARRRQGHRAARAGTLVLADLAVRSSCRHDGDVVVLAHGGLPANLYGAPGGHRLGRVHAYRRAGYVDWRAAHHAVALGEHVVNLVGPRLAGRPQLQGTARAGASVGADLALGRIRGHHGDVVLLCNGAVEAHLEPGAHGHLPGRLQGDPRIHQLDRRPAQDRLAAVAHVAYFVVAGLLRAAQGDRAGLARAPMVVDVPGPGLGRHDGDVVVVVDGGLPARLEPGSHGDLRRRLDGDVRGGWRLPFPGSACAHLGQRPLELAGRGCGEKPPAGGLGEALQLPLVLLPRDVEADDVGREVHPGALKHARGGTGVAVARLDAVGDQHRRGPALAVLEQLGSVLHRARQRRLAPGVDTVHGVGEGSRVQRSRLDYRLDVAAIALAPVTVGDQPDSIALGPVGDDIAQHVARDDDLVAALDLAPHAARGVEHDGDVVGVGAPKDPGRQQCRRPSRHSPRSTASTHHDSPVCCPSPSCCMRRYAVSSSRRSGAMRSGWVICM